MKVGINFKLLILALAWVFQSTGFSLPLEARKRIARKVVQYQKAVNQLTASDFGYRYYSFEGQCMDVSESLLKQLKDNFPDLKLAITDSYQETNVKPYLTIEGESRFVEKFHAYLVDRSLVEKYGEDAEIIIDPTYQQFFREKQRKLPKVLILRQEKLVDFYKPQESNFQLVVGAEDPFTGLYPFPGTDAFLYAYGKFAGFRMNL